MSVTHQKVRSSMKAQSRVVVALLVGVITGGMLAIFAAWQIAALGAWDVAALVYISWTVISVWRMDGETTSQHAAREDPSRGIARATVLAASVCSLGAVGLMLVESQSAASNQVQLLEIGFSVLSVVVSWVTIHTLFTLRYAELYYTEPVGGIDFQETHKPNYRDFAYLAFTMGMTFQVSDTSLRTTRLRKVALGHAILSYIFGVIIIAVTINLVAGLGK